MGMAAALIVSGVVFWSPGIKSLPAGLAVILGDASNSAYLASALVIGFAGSFLVKIGGNPSLGKRCCFSSCWF
jgi:peptidoglycan/LPS O-acetylase OafA/YrhL